MEDFNALAAAVAAGVDDVRGCLILSRDGLVLGASPATGEAEAKPAWLRLASIGEVERGFLQFGTEVWCYVRRGPYAAFALTGQGTRPGLVIDRMEQALLSAEEGRSRREGLRPGEAAGQPAAPSGKPRSPLHPEPRTEPQPEAEVTPPAPGPEREAEPVALGAEASSVFGPPPSAPPPEPSPATAGAPDTEAPDEAPTAADEDTEPAGEVDRFSLAREFSQLLQDEGGSADG